VIDLHGHEQEPLFPTSITERERMQEEHLDVLLEIAHRTKAVKDAMETHRKQLAGLKRKAAQLEELLRQSRPRK